MVLDRGEATRVVQLTGEGIDGCSDWLNEALGEMGIERRNLIRLRLTGEDALLCLRDRFGEQDEALVSIVNSLIGRSIRVEHVGEAYNPLSNTDADSDDSASLLFTWVGIRSHYSYVGGKNVLRIPLPYAGINPAAALLGGMFVGGVLGVLGMLVLPESTRDMVNDTLFSPLFNMWTRLLNALAGPVVFLMVITTLLDMRQVDERGGSWRHMVARYFGISFFIAFVTVVVSALVLRVGAIHEEIEMRRIAQLLDGMMRFIPEHIVEPFATSNTPQLLFLAAIVGSALIALGEQVTDLVRIVRQSNAVASLITNWVSSFVPLFAGILLALEIWDNQVTVLLQLWKPLLLSVITTAALMAIDLAVTCKQTGVGPRRLVEKLRLPFVTAMRAGTLDASYGATEYSCTRDLGMNEAFTSVTLPQGLVLYMPSSIVGTLAITMFCAREYGFDATASQYATMIVLDVLLFVATPPVPGANLLAYIALFGVLGISSDAFLDAMIFDILFGLVANAANQAMLQLEMVRQANRLGFLDRERLKA
ncbi:MAG: cation:dicarboxylase symporter family transporter [Atopobiaceae bacterium]|nr:cation:dicarboxylase symporter family transporter [Atopobiaceae bacterium]